MTNEVDPEPKKIETVKAELLPAATEPSSRAGRKTKLKPELQALFIKAIRAGSYRKDACAYVGISKATFVNWAKAGRDDPDSIHGRFLAAVLEAEQKTKMLMAASILGAARGNSKAGLKPEWKAAAWWLERKFPDQFGRAASEGSMARRDLAVDDEEEEDTVGDDWRRKFVEVENVFVPHDVQRAAIACTTRYMAIVAGVGGGKALRSSEPVRTPTGWTPICELRPGDTVIGGTGRPCKVLGVYPQGSLPLYRMTFENGRRVDCSGDHLWRVLVPREFDWSVLSTQEILSRWGTEPAPHDRITVPLLKSPGMVQLRSIEPAGEGEAVCIEVDDPTHTFVTRDYLVTHNTRSGAINFWQRVQLDDNPSAFYLLVAPDTVNGAVMCEHFVEVAPEGWVLNPAGTGPPYAKLWQLKNGARVQFRSADKPQKIVARRAHGIWVDEFTLLHETAWRVSLRGRMSGTGRGRQAWAIFTGTPRGQNWAFEDIWRRTIDHDDRRDEAYQGFTWPSHMNPAVDPDDVAEARRNLPSAYFDREWGASWEAFHGQVFEEWDPKTMVIDFSAGLTKHPKGSLIECGVDWGYAKPGAFAVGRFRPDEVWDILHEVHEAKRDQDWWSDKAVEVVETYGVTTFWCDPAEPDRIASMRKALKRWADEHERKAPRVKAADNRVSQGNRHLGKLIKQHRFRIHKTCVVLKAQLTSYQWAMDKHGEDTEEVVKVNDHLIDGSRYLTFSRECAKGEGSVTMGGAGGSGKKSRSRRRRRRRGK